MRKLLLITTLSVGALAWSQAAASDMGNSQSSGDDFYNQTIAAQAQQYSLDNAANSAFVAAESGSWNGTQPGSMASNTGAQSTEDFYNQTVAAQAQQYRLGKAANAAAVGVLPQSQSWNAPQPDSMAADMGSQSAEDDFYNQTVAEQAAVNSSFLAARELLASSPADESESGPTPDTMAANEGSSDSGADFYSQTVAIQANANRITLAGNQL